MLNDASVELDEAPLGDYENGDNDMDDEGMEEDEDGDNDDEVEEIEEGVFDGEVPPKGKSFRKSIYTEVEDAALIKAWGCVSLDAVTSTDQTGKRYWQRIEDKFFHFMPRLASTPARTYRSLQGRWDVKNACSRWAGCIEQVRNAPPSGTIIDEYKRIAMQRYKQMAAFKGKPFLLQHCYKLLEHSDK